LVAELDHSNPVMVCEVHPAQVDRLTDDGAGAGPVPDRMTTYTYDGYGRVSSQTTQSTTVGGGAVSTSVGPSTMVSRPVYVQNDAVTATATSATGRYLVDFPAFDDVEDSAGNRYRCSYTTYDGQPFWTAPALGHPTTQDRYTGCGSAPNFSNL